MRRAHLFEFSDLAARNGFGAMIQRMTPDYLRALFEQLHFYDAAAEKLATLLRDNDPPCIVDLCAGVGGPIVQLVDALTTRHGLAVNATLTDLVPHPEAVHHPRIHYDPRAIDARTLPDDLRGTRTLFDALHHFSPADVRAILQDAARTHSPIAIFESTERRLGTLLKILVLTPLLVLLITPFARPFRWSRLFFTYLVPLAPLVVWWDALVSCARSYAPEELRDLVTTLDSDGMTFTVGTLRSRGATVTYLLGAPRRETKK